MHGDRVIYLVIGETGRGAERKTWHVAAWRHQISAVTHVELSNRWLRERNMHAPWRPGWQPVPSPAPTNKFDPAMQYDFLTGTHYYTDEVKIFESPAFIGMEERPA